MKWGPRGHWKYKCGAAGGWWRLFKRGRARGHRDSRPCRRAIINYRCDLLLPGRFVRAWLWTASPASCLSRVSDRPRKQVLIQVALSHICDYLMFESIETISVFLFALVPHLLLFLLASRHNKTNTNKQSSRSPLKNRPFDAVCS